jgi:lipoprotein signal peptidase
MPDPVRDRRLGIAAALAALAADQAVKHALLSGAFSGLDRYLYHAVFDFLVVRLGHSLLFVCNIADIFISLGVVGLLLDAVWGESHSGAAS